MAHQLREARADRLTFFDRGVPDLIGYLSYRGLAPSPELLVSAADYTPLVFMAPPWRQIFVNDAERPQTFEEASAIHRELCRAYRECGFTVLALPLATVAARVEFVERTLVVAFARLNLMFATGIITQPTGSGRSRPLASRGRIHRRTPGIIS